MVNINHCTVSALTTKVGIPLSVARQIIAYKRDRKRKQAIECLDELKNIQGMTDQHFEKLLRHCKTFGYSALSSRTRPPQNATQRENKEREKGARRKLKAKRIRDTQKIVKTSRGNNQTKKVSHLITEIKKCDVSEGSCKKRKRSMLRKSKSGPKNRSDLPTGKARLMTKNRPQKKARLVKMEHIHQRNKNDNRRTGRGKVKSLVLNPVSVSASHSGNKLFVTYIPGLPEALNFLNSQKAGESLDRECPPPFASSPQPVSSSPRASSPPRSLSPQRLSSTPRPLSPQRSSTRPSPPRPSSSPPRPLSPQPTSSPARPLIKRASSHSCGSPESTKISRRESRLPALKRTKTPKRVKLNSPRTHRYMVSELLKKPEKIEHETQLSTEAIIKTCIDDRPEKDEDSKERSHCHHRLKKERRRHHSRTSKERRRRSRHSKKRRRHSSESRDRRRQHSRQSRKRRQHSKQGNKKRRHCNQSSKRRPSTQSNERRPRRHRHRRTVRFKNNGQHIYVDQLESPVEECSTPLVESKNNSPNNCLTERDLGHHKKHGKQWLCIII